MTDAGESGGVAVAVACAGCGEPVPPDARFCPACGREQRAGEEERRVVTVVFADLAGFTALAEGRDPEAVKELLDSCFGALVPVIELHGGHVDKIIGDELMAVFGAPVAHEDDSERAVRAALGLLDALRELDADLVLRIGINTGEVLAGPVGPGGAYTVTGDTVNTAHRLVSVAERGAILCGERTWAATNHVIRYEERAPYRLRGKQALVPAWSAVGVGRHPGASATHGGRATTPFVGRDGLLRQLATMGRDSFEQQRPFVVAITGEAGIGKTRLAAAVDQAMSDVPHLTLRAACPPYGVADPIAPVAALVRAALAVDPDALPGAQRARIANTVPPLAETVGADSALITARVNTLLGIGRTPRRAAAAQTGPMKGGVVDELLAAGRLVLEATAHQQPTLIILDDVHWADDALLSFLELLQSQVGHVPLFLIACGREEVFERRPRLARGVKGATPFPLGPLPDVSAKALLTTLLNAAVAPAATGDADHDATSHHDVAIGPETEQRLLKAAGGNPLLLEEVVRYLVNAGAVEESGGQIHIRFDPDDAPMPDGVRALIGARLDGLPADERRYLLDASVVGAQFWPAAVEAIGGGGDPGDAGDVATRLARKGLVERARDPSTGDLAFRHVLTRDVAYASLPIGERATRHAAVARWLEREFPSTTDGHIVRLIAHHYDRAVMLGRELEHTDPGLSGAAFEALVHAAREADRNETFREAERWYARALALGSLDRDAVLDAALDYGMTLVRLHRLDEARSQFELVRRDAGPSRPQIVATATARLATATRLQGDADGARQWFDDALQRWRQLNDSAGEAETLRLQGWAELSVGRPRSALPRLLRAAELERREPNGRESADTLRSVGWSEYLVGDFDAARASLWDAALRFSEDGDLGAMAWCWGILAMSFLQTGDIDRALEMAERIAELAKSQGDTWSGATCMLLEAAARATRGELATARTLAESADRLFRELDDVWGMAMAVLCFGLVHRLAGEWDEARDRLHAGLDLARRVEWVAEEARLLTELAAVEFEAGNVDEATRRARAALALVRAGIGDYESQLRSLCILGASAARNGDLAGAQLLLEEAAGPPGIVPVTTTLGWSLSQAALARVLVAAGEVEGSALRAAQAQASAGDSFEARGQAALALADVAEANGRTAGALIALRAVLDDTEGDRLALLEPIRAAVSRLVSSDDQRDEPAPM